MADFRRFVETSCFECVIDVVGWTDGYGDRNSAAVDVGILSFHARLEWRSWRARLGRAVRALRGQEYPWLEFYDGAELDIFIDALRDAGAVAFSPDATE
jgi:hypothetical protein